MAQSARKEKRHGQIRQEVVAAAEMLIKEEGVEALTIRKLAELLNYSPAALYEYFSSKEQIIVVLRQNIFRKQLELVRKVDPALPPEDYFQAICLEMLCFRMMPENYRIMFLQLSNEALQEVVSNDLIELRHCLDLALQRLNVPHLATASERQLAIFFLRSYLEGVSHLALRGEMPSELNCPVENTKKVVRLLIDGKI